MARKFESVSLPADLVALVDEFIRRNSQGYGTRPEVINDAIRRFIRDEMPDLKQPPADKPAKKKGAKP